MSLGVGQPHLECAEVWVSVLHVPCCVSSSDVCWPCMLSHTVWGVCWIRSPVCPCVTGLGVHMQTCPPGLPLLTCVTYSLVCWPSSEGTLSWPDLLSDPSIVGSTLQRLARGRMGRMLGPEEDALSLVSPSSPAKYFSASGEQRRGGCTPRSPGKAPRLGVGGAHAPRHVLLPLDEDLIDPG